MGGRYVPGEKRHVDPTLNPPPPADLCPIRAGPQRQQQETPTGHRDFLSWLLHQRCFPSRQLLPYPSFPFLPHGWPSGCSALAMGLSALANRPRRLMLFFFVSFWFPAFSLLCRQTPSVHLLWTTGACDAHVSVFPSGCDGGSHPSGRHIDLTVA